MWSWIEQIQPLLGTWAVARSAGITSFIGFGLSAIAGMISHWKAIPPIARAKWNILHQWTGWFAWLFLILHLMALVLDHYVHYTIFDLLVPFRSSQHWFANGLGSVAMYLFALIILSSDFIRSKVPRLWKFIHQSAFPAFLLMLAHALIVGTDRHKWIVVGVYMGLSIVFIVLAWFRQKPESNEKPTRVRSAKVSQ